MVMNAIQYLEEDEEDWYMRIDVMEELNREVQQEDAMQKFQAKQGKYDVLDDTNQDFVMQEINAKQKNNGDMQLLHLEMQQQRADEVHPHNGELQPKFIDLWQQKNKGEVQQKTKYVTLKGRPSRMLNHLPPILKYAFLGNTKNLTCQCKMLDDISHMLNTMKHEVRKLWDPGNIDGVELNGALQEISGSPTHRHGSWRLGVLWPDPTMPKQPLIKSRRGQQLCLSTLRRGNPQICVDRYSSAPEASIAQA
ncbi:hypothetical protein PIB30_097952 [Stylosanthes scabra]|uniref:Uncharacterized protein n=1 Tax=Stylosanthes scabra TaxID=79078 RepID=A0ABU6TYY5_9FABA|nr:hypothetical protein [Stylosanthes scabra]